MIRRLFSKPDITPIESYVVADFQKVADRIEALRDHFDCSLSKIGEQSRSENADFKKTLFRQYKDLQSRIDGLELLQKEAQLKGLSAGSSLSDGAAGENDGLVDSSRSDVTTPNEIRTCRQIEDRAIFVIGYARSATTITAQIVNSSPEAFVLGEANFFSQNPGPRFRDWYNDQHVRFKNQVSKTCYAPDFIPYLSHTWWQWISEAARYYTFVGDKMAFSATLFQQIAPESIQAFFEARFYNAKYIFLLRDPIQTIVSAMKLFQFNEDEQARSEIIGWLKYVKMWCDWIRVFPNSVTLVADTIDESFVAKISDFLSVDLSPAVAIIDSRERRVHSANSKWQTLSDVTLDLDLIYQEAKRALNMSKAKWQSEQKRDIELNNTIWVESAPTAVAPNALGQTWALADHLIKRLSLPTPAGSDS